MSALATGTVTFLFADVEGSTRLLEHLGDRYAEVLADYRRLFRIAFQACGGQEVDTQGDAFFVAFSRARDALSAAIAVQRTVLSYAWPDGVQVRVRMGLHTGEPLSTETGYVGMDVHKAARICAVAHGGQILLSQTTCNLVQDELREGMSLRDLGEHRLKDLARPQHLFQIVAAGLPVDFPHLHSLAALPNNLSVQLTSFVGREKEVEEVTSLLQRKRLLTLTGVGGIGKTRLALQVAADLTGEFPDGVWWVDLAPLTDPEFVPQAVASAVGLREHPGRPLVDVLLDHLRAKRLLLVLDNCEHLLAACAHLVEALLRGCPHLRLLATSREALAIAGETSYPVSPLTVPDPQRVPPVEDLARYEAIRLFTERACAVLPTFRLTEENAPAVVQVCKHLDGIPLTIEMAAARGKVLPVQEIATRLDDRFRLLTGGSRTAPPRHKTLRAAMDWSYDLLSVEERVLLRRLSVFAGGWGLEAAEAICSGESVEADDILDLLARLVDKSLVIAEAYDGEGRFRMLETVRQYSRDRLVESGEEPILSRRHRDRYLGLAVGAERELHGPDQAKWLARLELEHDNLRAALASTEAEGDVEPLLRLAGALWWFWTVRAHYHEGSRWLAAALSAERTASPGARAKALYGAGVLAWARGDLRQAGQLCAESLGLCRDLGDRTGIAYSLGILGVVAWFQADYARAAALLEECLTLARELGYRWPIAMSLSLLGQIAQYLGDYARAGALVEEGLTLFRQLEDRWGIAFALLVLGIGAWRQADYGRAAALLEESIALSRDLGDQLLLAWALHDRGIVAFVEGNYARAGALHREALALRRERGEKWTIPDCLEGLADVAAAEGRPDRAARLFAAGESLRRLSGAPRLPADQPKHAGKVAALRTRLGEPSFATAWAQGERMTVEQAIEYALEELTEGPTDTAQGI